MSQNLRSRLLTTQHDLTAVKGDIERLAGELFLLRTWIQYEIGARIQGHRFANLIGLRGNDTPDALGFEYSAQCIGVVSAPYTLKTTDGRMARWLARADLPNEEDAWHEVEVDVSASCCTPQTSH